MKRSASNRMPAGKQVLFKDGQAVWMGDLGAPTEDVDCDEIVLHPDDFERLKAAAPEKH